MAQPEAQIVFIDDTDDTEENREIAEIVEVRLRSPRAADRDIDELIASFGYDAAGLTKP